MRHTIRETAPSAYRRSIECYGGPWDGQRAALEADCATIDLPGGTYTLAVVTRGERTAEQLRWRED